MSGVVRVKRGDSLWSIASGMLPMGASDREVREAIRLIADASGLEIDARPKPGQSVHIPEAVDRLIERIRSEPLVHLPVSWRRPNVEPVGSVPLDAIANVPVRRARIDRFVDIAVESLHPDALTTLSISFGPLSRARFDHLHTSFGGTSLVEYRRGRSYGVVDFMPPYVQALVNLDLEVPRAQRLAGTRGWIPSSQDRALEVSFDPNSHGLAYETVRQTQLPDTTARLFHGDRLAMERVVHESGRFKRISSATRWMSRIPRLALKPGDLVQFYEQTKWSRSTRLVHSAVHVGGGLFFEKPTTEIVGEPAPFRLGTFSMIAAPITYAADRVARVEVHRATSPLPLATEAFRSGHADRLAESSKPARGGRSGIRSCPSPSSPGRVRGGHEQLSALVELPIVLDDGGRAALERV
ncbi:MAG: LysM peptidoglycan-binding domain-containing protein [Ilumatobacteraceae bacterium]